MHKAHGRDGLVAISVALEDPKSAQTRKEAEKLLEKLGATFTNVLLPEENKSKLKIEGPPLIFVFDRDNRIAARFEPGKNGEEIDKKAVEGVVRKLLEKKK